MPHNLFEYHTMGAGAVGAKRFSFNFPSGKKWTLSNSENARAQAFFCGSGGGGGGGTGGTGPIMDIAYCTGGEGAYDGKPTFWTSSARKGCKTNNQGQSMPYGREISKEEYDLGYSGNVINPPTPTQNCPAPLGKEALIQQAKQLALIDLMQERYGSMGQNSFKENFRYYENCPFYSELLSTYNQARANAPRLPPIYNPR